MSKLPDLPELKPHAVCDLFPPPTAEEYAMIKEDIAEYGMMMPVITWRDESGELFLVDGRTRYKILKELRGSGMTVARNGRPLVLPMWEFHGTEKGMMKTLMSHSLVRRNITPEESREIKERLKCFPQRRELWQR